MIEDVIRTNRDSIKFIIHILSITTFPTIMVLTSLLLFDIIGFVCSFITVLPLWYYGNYYWKQNYGDRMSSEEKQLILSYMLVTISSTTLPMMVILLFYILFPLLLATFLSFGFITCVVIPIRIGWDSLEKERKAYEESKLSE